MRYTDGPRLTLGARDSSLVAPRFKGNMNVKNTFKLAFDAFAAHGSPLLSCMYAMWD